MKLIIVFICLPFILAAQNYKSVLFTNDLKLMEIQRKAKSENRPVFIFIYAQWCNVCKSMEKDVFTIDSLDRYLNARFLCAKVELNDFVKDTFYNKDHYEISVLPAFLFFSPDGKALHKGQGYYDVADLISLSNDALNPSKQFYTLLENYNKKNIAYQLLPYLARTARQLGDTTLANNVANQYIEDYLLTLEQNKFFTKENIGFMASFVQKSGDKAFEYFLKRCNTIDEVMKDSGYSQTVIQRVIYKEEVSPAIAKAINEKDEPNWKKLGKQIKNKFGSLYSEQVILNAKLKWYGNNENWDKYINIMIYRIEKYGPFGIGIRDFDLNNHAWLIFLHSSDSTQLNKALSWANMAVTINPNYSNSWDTYANLLFKLGRKKEALKMEERAIELDPRSAEYKKTFENIKNGIKTWSD